MKIILWLGRSPQYVLKGRTMSISLLSAALKDPCERLVSSQRGHDPQIGSHRSRPKVAMLEMSADFSETKCASVFFFETRYIVHMS